MLSLPEIEAAQRQMRTPVHARRVEALQAEMKKGFSFTVAQIAKRLALPVQIIIAIYWQFVRDAEGIDAQLGPDTVITNELEGVLNGC